MNREELRKKVANNIDGLFHNKHSFEDMADRLINLIQSNTESKDEWEYTEDPENDKTLWICHEGKIKKGWFDHGTWNTTLKAMHIGDSDCNIKIQNVVCWCEIAIPKMPKDST